MIKKGLLMMVLIAAVEGQLKAAYILLPTDTDLSLHPDSPGYRLISNNVLFPAAKKKERKT